MKIADIWSNEKKLKSATGLNKDEAEELLSDFQIEIARIESKKRKNGGRPNKFPPLNYFLMMMFQLRHHVTFEVLGFMFELDPSNAKRRYESTETVVRGILGKKKALPLNTSKTDKPSIKSTLESNRETYIDGTEQPVRRPKDNLEQKENYSGKKKQHTSKILIATNENNRIEVITPVYVGSTHDFAMFKEEDFGDCLPPGKPIYIDNGFQGAETLYPDIKFRKPKKKPRGRKLNGGERLGNRMISRKRVKVEHAVGRIKKFKSASSICRNITKSMDETFEIVAGIVNFQIDRALNLN